MRWDWRITPTVPRAVVDAERAAHGATVDAVRADLATQHARYDALVAEVLALKREGFCAEPSRPGAPSLPTIDPVVEDVILEVAGPGPSPLRTALVSYALANPLLSPHTVAAHIRRGG